MSTKGSADVGFIFVDGYNLLGSITEIRNDIEVVLEPTTVLGDAWVSYWLVGLMKGTLSHTGFYDAATGQVNDALAASLGLSRIICWNLEGNALGAKFIGYQGALETKYERILQLGALHKASGTYSPSGNIDQGVVTHARGANATGSWTGTGVDNGSASAAGGAGYLQVSALTLGGYTNAVIKIRHSADNITYADLVTFTAVTAAPFAERKTVAGAVYRYIADAGAFTGSGAGQTITYMAGFARG